MARNKKAINKFHEKIIGAVLPRAGNDDYRVAMDSLRDYVEENCPYGTRVEVDTFDGFRIYLSTKIFAYWVAPGVRLDDGFVHTDIDLDAPPILIAQVEGHNEKLRKIKSLTLKNINK